MLDCGKDTRGIGSLAPTWLEEIDATGLVKQPLKEELFKITGQEALTEFTEHRRVEAGIGEFQPKHVFPINSGANRVSRLAIGQPFGKLEDQHECEARW